MTFCAFLSKISLPNSAYISNFYGGLGRLTNTTLFPLRYYLAYLQ